MDPKEIKDFYFYPEPVLTRYKNYYRIAIFSIDFIHRLSEQNPVHTIAGIRVKVWGKKMKCFKSKGTRCPRCHRPALFYALERDAHQNKKNWHLNLYGVGTKGEFMFTADHIFPWSKGGSGRLENLQPMCAKCNSHKGNKVPKKLQFIKLDKTGKIIPATTKETEHGGTA